MNSVTRQSNTLSEQDRSPSKSFTPDGLLKACTEQSEASIRQYVVFGRPLPKGSLIGLCPYQKRHKQLAQRCYPVVTADTRSGGNVRLSQWLTAIALATNSKEPTITGPCTIAAKFVFARPKAASSIERARVGDVDKLLRALCDGIQRKAGYGGKLIEDDRQIVALTGTKRFAAAGEPEHCAFTLALVDLD